MFARAEHDAVHSHGARGRDVDLAIVNKQRLRGGHAQSLQANVINAGIGFHDFQLAGKAEMVEESQPLDAFDGGSRQPFATCWR